MRVGRISGRAVAAATRSTSWSVAGPISRDARRAGLDLDIPRLVRPDCRARRRPHSTLAHGSGAPSRRLSLWRGEVRSVGALSPFRPLPLFALPEGHRQRARDQPVRLARAIPLEVGQGARRPLRSADRRELRNHVLQAMWLASAPPYAQRSRAGRARRIARRRTVAPPSRTDLLRLGRLVGLRERRSAFVLRIPRMVATKAPLRTRPRAPRGRCALGLDQGSAERSARE